MIYEELAFDFSEAACPLLYATSDSVQIGVLFT